MTPSPWLRSLLVFACSLACTSPVWAGERFYMVVFAAEKTRTEAKASHTFATFVRAVETPGCPQIEAHTISWMPASFDVKLWRLTPEPGANIDLETTLNVYESWGAEVTRWGPYEIEKDLYDRALEQIAHLESGEVMYKAIDSVYRTDTASNCIHAVSDLARKPRLRIASPGWGCFASFVVARRLRPWIIDTNPEEWLAEKLGLCNHPMTVGDLDTNPRGILGNHFCPLRCGQ